MDCTNSTLAVIRNYHNGWATKDFRSAAELLDENLQVEVPVNSYPTKQSFASALAAFGVLTNCVLLLGEFAKGNEGMLLYDMHVNGLGHMRVAEHFTVRRGRITRIRQIHDTAALRTAGFVPP